MFAKAISVLFFFFFVHTGSNQENNSVYVLTVNPSYSFTTTIVIGNASHSSAALWTINGPGDIQRNQPSRYPEPKCVQARLPPTRSSSCSYNNKRNSATPSLKVIERPFAAVQKHSSHVNNVILCFRLIAENIQLL